MVADKAEIMKALEKVQDPELKRSLVELNMIRDVTSEGGNVKVNIALTTPGCPLKKKIESDVVTEVGKLPGVATVAVEFGQMTDEEKKALAVKIRGKEPEEKEDPFPRTRVIAVGSGKGGVGKSTVTVNLARSLKDLGYRVGLMDADVYGYSIPRLLGLEGQKPAVLGEKNIVPLDAEGMAVISIGNFLDEDKALIWRGPLLMGVMNQFIYDVLWDDPDYLLIDLPPGTGDIPLTVMQTLKKSHFLLVTTPQILAFKVAGRLSQMAKTAKINMLGIVENMAYFTCDNCGKEHYLFGKEETEQMAERLDIPILASFPFFKEISVPDKSSPPLENREIASLYKRLAQTLAEKLPPL